MASSMNRPKNDENTINFQPLNDYIVVFSQQKCSLNVNIRPAAVENDQRAEQAKRLLFIYIFFFGGIPNFEWYVCEFGKFRSLFVVDNRTLRITILYP